jgi:hypothetical protein
MTKTKLFPLTKNLKATGKRMTQPLHNYLKTEKNIA